ncbi:MAG: hypothetical protein BGO80_13715 [Devosia sp. 63-57]|nr:MAG: hypothetical protein ABS74_16140 [Pelagibacterium sp. SCN 63-126]OJX42528.1 MAG: hypothetical protein BGO80_13715 [Devosia sp. 63-57]
MDNVVSKTGVLQFVMRTWAKLIRRPGQLSTELAQNPSSKGELRMTLEKELFRLDEFHESRNNWLSIFVCGLLDEDVLEWLYAQFSRPGRFRDDPLLTV